MLPNTSTRRTRLLLPLCTPIFLVQEGDRLRATDYVTGCVEVRQLRSVYKLSFSDIVRVNRFKQPTAVAVPQTAASDEESTGSGSEEKAKTRKEPSVRLHVFLTKKKPKTRMADLEETAFLLRLDVGTDGCICSGKSLGNFDQVSPQQYIAKYTINRVLSNSQRP